MGPLSFLSLADAPERKKERGPMYGDGGARRGGDGSTYVVAAALYEAYPFVIERLLPDDEMLNMILIEFQLYRHFDPMFFLFLNFNSPICFKEGLSKKPV